MADIKISALTSSSALDGTEEAVIVQSGVTTKTTTQEIANLTLSQVELKVTNPVISGGSTGSIELLPTLAAGKAYIIDSINTFTTVPMVGTGAGNPSLSIHYAGDGGSVVSGIPFLISGSGSNTVWSASASANRYIDIESRGITYKISHGTDQTFTGELTIWLRYTIVDV